MGNLERLQRSVVELLRSVSDLRLADIKAEDSDDNAGKAEGLRVTVLRPLPRAASRYAAGPVFSEVEISVEIMKRISPYVDGYYLMTPFGRTGLIARILKAFGEA